MPKKRAASESISEDSLVVTPKKNKKARVIQGASGGRTGSAPAPLTTPEGDEYWEIPAGSKRRLTVSMFKSMPLVSVREYYEAGGEMKPGKKGISLTVAQFASVIEALPAIEKSLKKKGHDLPRPVYGGDAGGDDVEGMDEDDDAKREVATDDEEEEEEEDEPPKRRDKSGKKGKKAHKRNIEETSDEEEDEE